MKVEVVSSVPCGRAEGDFWRDSDCRMEDGDGAIDRKLEVAEDG